MSDRKHSKRSHAAAITNESSAKKEKHSRPTVSEQSDSESSGSSSDSDSSPTTPIQHPPVVTAAPVVPDAPKKKHKSKHVDKSEPVVPLVLPPTTTTIDVPMLIVQQQHHDATPSQPTPPPPVVVISSLPVQPLAAPVVAAATSVVDTKKSVTAKAIREQFKNIQQDSFVKRPNRFDWELTTSDAQLKLWNLAVIPTPNNKGSSMFKVMCGNSEVEIQSPIMKVHKASLHGVGELSEQAKNGDADRKFKLKIETIMTDEMAARNRGIKEGPWPKNVNNNLMDEEIIKHHPELIDEQERFYVRMHGPVLDRISQLYAKAMNKDISEEIKALIALHKIQGIDMENPAESLVCISYISGSKIMSELESMPGPRPDANKPFPYAFLLRQLIDPIRKTLVFWVNKGGRPGVKTDADLNIHALGLSCKVFYPKKGAKKDDGAPGSVTVVSGVNAGAQNQPQGTASGGPQMLTIVQNTPKSLEAVKSLEGGGGGALTEEELERDVLVGEVSRTKLTPKQINRIINKLQGGRNATHSYSLVRFFNLNGKPIKRDDRPVHEQFVFAQDYVGAKFKFTLSSVGESKYCTATISSVTFAQEGLRQETEDDNENDSGVIHVPLSNVAQGAAHHAVAFGGVKEVVGLPPQQQPAGGPPQKA